MKLDFLLCGSANDAFYSQFALFRASLDRLGGFYRQARVVAALGGDEILPVPACWSPHLERVEVVWADTSEHVCKGTYAQSDLRFELFRPDADLVFLCDADTVLLRALPHRFLTRATSAPALLGVIAHVPFPIDESARRPLISGMEPARAWQALAQVVLGRRIRLRFEHTLPLTGSPVPCPFYVNYGFVAGTPAMLSALHRELRGLQPRVAQILGNDFYGQVSIALAVEKLNLPHRALPMRYNFPNDRRAERLFPREAQRIIVLHYLRRRSFDRHLFLADETGYRAFLSESLAGTDVVLRDHVTELFGVNYPFG